MKIRSFVSGPASTNSYIAACPKTHEAVIIDPSFALAPLEEYLKKHHLKATQIWLTHSHWDHLAQAADLTKTLNVPLYIHYEDAPNLVHPGSDGLPLFFPIQGIKPDY